MKGQDEGIFMKTSMQAWLKQNMLGLAVSLINLTYRSELLFYTPFK